MYISLANFTRWTDSVGNAVVVLHHLFLDPPKCILHTLLNLKLGIAPTHLRLARPSSHLRTEKVPKPEPAPAYHRRQDTLRREAPCEAVGGLPGRDEEGAHKGGQVEQDGIKRDDGHGLERVGVDDIRRDDGVAGLDARGDEEEGDLPDYPVVAVGYGYTPYYEADYWTESG